MLAAAASKPATALNGRAGRLRPAAGRPSRSAVGVKAWGGGYDKWKGEWDGSNLDPELKDRLVTYGELVQAAYDNLAWNPWDEQVGNSTKAPADFLLVYDYNYSLVPNHYLREKGLPEAPPAGEGTNEKFHLPSTSPPGLTPLIRALPGQGQPPKLRPPRGGNVALWAWRNRSQLLDFVVYTSGGLAVTKLFGNRPLFRENLKTGGHTVQAVSAFMGYVAVSPPDQNGEVEVVFVWRGTIFKEEWSNNFAQDRLVAWQNGHFNPDDGDETKRPTPKPWEIGVHDGFSDLYLRPCFQTGPVPEDTKGKDGVERHSPRKAVHEWLKLLLKDYTVKAISTTGHSLGGALCTLCAFDIAEYLETYVFNPQPEGKPPLDRTDWKTAAAPPVTSYAFASPRVGNFPFMRQFSDEYKARNLRVCNSPDAVPKVPGFWLQALTGAASRALGLNLYANMDSPLVRGFAWLYTAWCGLLAPVWPSKFSYFHVGQILEVDSSKNLGEDVLDGTKTKVKGDVGKAHNLELYLYLLSKFGLDPSKHPYPTRNFFLLNKSDDLVGYVPPDDEAAPASSTADKSAGSGAKQAAPARSGNGGKPWAAAGKGAPSPSPDDVNRSHPLNWLREGDRGMVQDAQGRWDYKDKAKAAAAAAAAPAKAAADAKA